MDNNLLACLLAWTMLINPPGGPDQTRPGLLGTRRADQPNQPPFFQVWDGGWGGGGGGGFGSFFPPKWIVVVIWHSTYIYIYIFSPAQTNTNVRWVDDDDDCTMVTVMLMAMAIIANYYGVATPVLCMYVCMYVVLCTPFWTPPVLDLGFRF